MRINSYSSAADYIEDLKKTVDLQKLGDSAIYLAISAAAQCVLQKQGPWTGIDVISATKEKGAFHYLGVNGWDDNKSSESLCTNQEALSPLIKLRRADREILENNLDYIKCLI
jgi:hypothetical protein